MVSEVIKADISTIIDGVKRICQEDIKEEMAFNYLTLWYFYMCSDLDYRINNTTIDTVDYTDLHDCITDGANDGGVDYIYFDESESKIVLAQSKYVNKLTYNDIIAELKKMSNTVDDFLKHSTGGYNDNLKRELQNAIDRLPDNSVDVEYVIFTTASLDDTEQMLSRIDKDNNSSLTRDSVSIYSAKEIESQIESLKSVIATVSYDKIKIYRPKNSREFCLSYESDEYKGIMVNVSSQSIVSLYNKYKDNGLFDLNIRRYIRNKMVDEGIKTSLDKYKNEFWFLNNGIIIACKDYDIDGDTVILEDFSIVNGGQTTHLIGKHKFNNNDNFFVPCKIVAKKEAETVDYEFFNRIAQATNSQKPIYIRDLKSNSPEMRRLQELFSKEGIFLEIKRGETISKRKTKFIYHIKNDELAQLIISLIHQRPGTARSNKEEIFKNPKLYGQVFRVRYDKDVNKKKCLIDIVKFNDRYEILVKKLMSSPFLSPENKNILKNGKQAIFAIIGLLYMLANKDISVDEIAITPSALINDNNFVFSTIFSDYNGDDLDEILTKLITLIIEVITLSYELAFEKGKTTSISNYLKKDTSYIEEIVPRFAKDYAMFKTKEYKEYSKIFVRKAEVTI